MSYDRLLETPIQEQYAREEAAEALVDRLDGEVQCRRCLTRHGIDLVDVEVVGSQARKPGQLREAGTTMAFVCPAVGCGTLNTWVAEEDGLDR